MSELKPCPFCGGTKICTEKGINLNYCDNCSAESNVEHWNTRPIEDALNKRIAELEAERRWIPVGERLPKENAPVLVLTVLGGMFVDFIHGKSVVTGNPDFYELDIEDVTHWMPLPPSPESEVK